MSTVNDRSQQPETLGESASSGPPSPNPLAQFSNITVSMPESVEVRFVDASTLFDYEIWSLLTSILSSAVVGFLVGYFQADEGNKQLYGWIAGVFFLLMVFACTMVFSKRRALTKRTRKLRFSVGEQLSPDEQ